MIDPQHLNILLNQKAHKFNQLAFIDTDPISIPHKFSNKHDIEIAAFLATTIAWGNRKAILKSANQLMAWMDNSPYDFVTNASEQDLKPFEKFVYRTFNGTDCQYFLSALKHIYLTHGGLEPVFNTGYAKTQTVFGTLNFARTVFFEMPHPARTQKHFANPAEGSAAKRLNLFLRWMVRHDASGVDFGLWKQIPMSKLMIPLDVHSGNVARQLGLLSRKQNDWKAVEELTSVLVTLDAADPIKYDFALFGMGVFNDI